MLLHPGDPHVAEQNSYQAHERETVEQYLNEAPHAVMANGKLTDDEERAKDNRIGTCG